MSCFTRLIQSSKLVHKEVEFFRCQNVNNHQHIIIDNNEIIQHYTMLQFILLLMNNNNNNNKKEIQGTFKTIIV
jgi:hypothetical protein